MSEFENFYGIPAPDAIPGTVAATPPISPVLSTDSYYAIGHAHEVCEDYATAMMDKDVAFAIVSDGCSASANVDFGARALALSAVDAVRTTIRDPFMGEIIIKRASNAVKLFSSLDYRSVDATLLLATYRDGVADVWMWGDGVAVISDETGMWATHVDYESGAPYYLSYELSPSRLDEYRQTCNQPKVTTSKHYAPGFGPVRNHSETSGHFSVETRLTHRMNGNGFVAVMSDGINTFKDGAKEVTWAEMLQEFVGFKSMHGQFVKRRMNFLRRTCQQKLMVHNDDISLAAISVQRNPGQT